MQFGLVGVPSAVSVFCLPLTCDLDWCVNAVCSPLPAAAILVCGLFVCVSVRVLDAAVAMLRCCGKRDPVVLASSCRLGNMSIVTQHPRNSHRSLLQTLLLHPRQ